MKLQDRAVLVRLGIESWGVTRQDDEANRAVAEAKHSTERATRVSKRLAPDDTLKGVKSKAEEARKYVRHLSQVWGEDGARLLDATRLFPLQEELRRKYRPAWQHEVNQVLAKLDYLRDVWGPANLGDLYAAALYPDAARMECAFKWKLDVLPLNPDSKELRNILGTEYVDELQANAERELNERLVTRILEPIQNMIRRLTEPDGKFKDSLVENVRDIARLIPALNLTNDVRLAAVEQQITDELTRYSADTLRRNRSARNETAEKARAILDRVSDYLGEVAPAPVSPTGDVEKPGLIIPALPPMAQLVTPQAQPAGNGWFGI